MNAADRWADQMRDRLESAYLAGDNPRAQSGFGGDASYWEIARGVIADAIDRSGTFLDVGCASGQLMESMVAWGAAKGVVIEPHGLELLAPLAELARSRLPQWAHRIHVGDARSWRPTQRYDFVRTELVYAPDAEQRHLVAHLLDTVVAPGGRLIVCSYGSRTRPEPRALDLRETLLAWGYPLGGASEATVMGRMVSWVRWIPRN